jgi:predicted RNase H-like HicB family nuclease
MNQPDGRGPDRFAMRAGRYTYIICPDDDDGFLGHAIELPAVFGEGSTIEACAAATEASVRAALHDMADRGEALPDAGADAADGRIELLLSQAEVDAFRAAAARLQIGNVTDFVRSAAMMLARGTLRVEEHQS